jgi:hypothetical protein
VLEVVWLIVKFVLGAALSFAIQYYVWRKTVRAASLARRWHRALTGAMIALGVAIPLTTWTRDVWPEFSTRLAWISMPWFALVALVLVALIGLGLARLVGRALRAASRRPAPTVSSDRRAFLARVTGGTAVLAGSASVARGMFEARGTHEIVDVEVALAKLPPALDGFTIVQLSDLHVGFTIDRAFVQRVVDHTNKLAPDLIALTGDFVDGKVKDLRDDIAPLAELRARHGVYAVTGNHEYYAGADSWIEEITRLGARYLRNERVAIERDGAAFELAGVDDHNARGDGHGEDLERALAGRDASRVCVLLAHQPRQVRRAAKYGVDLQLSGHTHGGQIWPWHYLVRLQQGGMLAGRYEHEGTQLYVTRGCGYWGPPVRVLAPLEITRVILRSAA